MKQTIKFKFLIAMSILIFFLAGYVRAENITLSYNELNTTNTTFFTTVPDCFLLLFNSSYNLTFCANFTQRNVYLVLEQNQTFNISEENITVLPRQVYCPAFPVQDFCSVDTFLQPNVGLTNYSYYNNTQGSCRLNITVGGCEVPIKFAVPENFTLVSNEQWTLTQNIVNQTVRCAEDLSSEQTYRYFLERDVEILEESVCRFNDTELITGYRQLNSFSREHLRYFVRLNKAVNQFEFAELIAPNVSADTKLYLSTLSINTLEQYRKVGFAEVTSETVLTQFGNQTIFYYKPQLNEFCLERINDLFQIQREGISSGRNQTFIWMGIFILITAFGFFIVGRKPLIVAR